MKDLNHGTQAKLPDQDGASYPPIVPNSGQGPNLI